VDSEFAVDVSAKKFTRWHTHPNPKFGKGKNEPMFVQVEGDRCNCKLEGRNGNGLSGSTTRTGKSRGR
jgi:hypothetical protein